MICIVNYLLDLRNVLADVDSVVSTLQFLLTLLVSSRYTRRLWFVISVSATMRMITETILYDITLNIS